MGAAALIMLREGLEASLVVGIVLAYLTKLQQQSRASYVWAGVGAATAASAAVAALFSWVAGGFEGTNEALFEGAIMLAAAGVLTSIILWMQRQARHIKSQLEHEVGRALTTGQLWGLAALAFVAVFREGVESVLFLGAVFLTHPDPLAAVGAVAGLQAAVLLAYLIFRASVALDLRRFFYLTGLALVLVAAGLLAGGVHELQEAGWLPTLVNPLWDLSRSLSEQSLVGASMKALFGYNSDPSLLEVLAWVAYVGLVGGRYLGVTRAAFAVAPPRQGAPTGRGPGRRALG